MTSQKKQGAVLVIDDEALFRFMLKDALREGGFKVFLAKDGEEGVEIFKKELPDVVITDLVMPVKGGVSTGMEINTYAKTVGANPVVVLFSAMFKEKVKEYGSPEMGACYHMSKALSPIDVTILVEQLYERNLRRIAK